MPTQELTRAEEVAIEALFYQHKLAVTAIKAAQRLALLVERGDMDKAKLHAVKSIFKIANLAEEILSKK